MRKCSNCDKLNICCGGDPSNEPCEIWEIWMFKEIKPDKLQFTEKESIEFLLDAGIADGEIDACIKDLKKSNRIKKSELQTLVKECEEILLHNTTQNTEYINLEKQEKILETIYKLKKDHPEFKNK